MKKTILLYIASLFLVVGALSCGQVSPDLLTTAPQSGTSDGSINNGSISSINGYLAGGGIGGTGITSGISVGRITDFGSIFVNGVEFDTEGAIIRMHDMEVNEDDLKVGMIVEVQGEYYSDGVSGKAEVIEYKSILKGQVVSVDTATLTLTVLGHEIRTDSNTYMYDKNGSPISIFNIVPGNVVEVSGFIDSKGVIHATYIGIDKDSMDIMIKGFINNLNMNEKTFTVNDITVDFSGAEMENIPVDGLSEGMYVCVQSISGFNENAELIATSVKVKPHLFSTMEGEHLEIEGLITRVMDTNNFEVNGQPVKIVEETIFEHGLMENITLDMKVEVEGTVDDQGILVAEEISLESEDGSQQDGDLAHNDQNGVSSQAFHEEDQLNGADHTGEEVSDPSEDRTSSEESDTMPEETKVDEMDYTDEEEQTDQAFHEEDQLNGADHTGERE